MFLEQTFALGDLPKIALLAFLELLLSADNAIVLALICRPLPEQQRRKALFIGVFSAFLFRAIALLAASQLLKYRWIQLIGALYLLYVAIHAFWGKKSTTAPPKATSFWSVVFLIELFDLAFAIDSILAGIAFINSGPVEGGIHPKLWIVYVGGMIGLLGTRFSADLFNHLLSRFPRLETSAYLLVGLVGIKLASYAIDYPLPAPIFWTGSALLLALGFVRRK